MTITLFGPYESYLLNQSGSQVQIDPQCAGFIVVNRNRYTDLVFALTQQQPNVVPSTANPAATGWQFVVPAGQSMRCIFSTTDQVPTTPSAAAYTVGPGSTKSGLIWAAYVQTGPVAGFINPFDSVLATGTISFSSPFYIICWGEGDEPPDISSAAPTVDLTGQPRIVQMRTAPPFVCSDTATIAAINTWTNVGNAINLSSLPFSNASITNGAVPGLLCIVLYSFCVGFPGASTSLSTTYKFRIAILDSSLTSVATVASNMGADADYHSVAIAFPAGESPSVPLCFTEPRVMVVKASAGAGAPYWAQPQIEATAAAAGSTGAPTVDCHYDITPVMPAAPGSLLTIGNGAGMVPPPDGGSYAF